MKRTALFLIIIVGCSAIVSVLYIPSHIWTARLMDGANGAFGPSGRGIGFSTATWESMTGIVVEEIVVSYRSPEDARSDFEVALRDGGSVTERTDNTAASHQRAVKVFDTQARQGACEIITLSGQRIHFVKAGALKYALGFEKAWIKF